MGTAPNPLFQHYTPAPYLSDTDLTLSGTVPGFTALANDALGNSATPTDGFDDAFSPLAGGLTNGINVAGNIAQCYQGLLPVIPAIQNFDSDPVTLMIVAAMQGSDAGIDAVTTAIGLSPFAPPAPSPTPTAPGGTPGAMGPSGGGAPPAPLPEAGGGGGAAGPGQPSTCFANPFQPGCPPVVTTSGGGALKNAPGDPTLQSRTSGVLTRIAAVHSFVQALRTGKVSE